MANPDVTVLCLASYHKGHGFLREVKRLGCRVILVTSESLRGADWPRECLDGVHYVADVKKKWKLDDLLQGVSHLAQSVSIDRIVPLDDFDLERASALREHLRVPGMGETTTRYFRDKLAMRMKALDAGIPVPPFVHLLNDDRIREFCRQVAAPWVLKPRSEAGTIGIQKVDTDTGLWAAVEALGDRRSHYLLEQFVPGDVFHVDSIVYGQVVQFAVASRYGTPPMEVSHGGGVFTSSLLQRGSPEECEVQALNRRLLPALGLVRGVSHSEFIRSRDGGWYFLETSARVGGAHISELVEMATGLDLWAEWARVEVAGGQTPYQVQPVREEYAGLLVALSRQEWPALDAYADPEVVWRLTRRHHAGLIVRSPDHARVEELLSAYRTRFGEDFLATMPAREHAE